MQLLMAKTGLESTIRVQLLRYVQVSPGMEKETSHGKFHFPMALTSDQSPRIRSG